jgi:hypothetical protein
VLSRLEESFRDADVDQTLTLDKVELSRLLVDYYKAEKLGRSLPRVRNEVTVTL